MEPVTIYTITPGKPETIGYDPARFIVKGTGKTAIIDSWAPSLGWLDNRKDIDAAELAHHLENMKNQGFRVEEIRI